MKLKVSFLVFSALSSGVAEAGYSLYDGQYGELNAGLLAETAVFGELNNQGGAEQKAGLTDVFWDINIKPHLEASVNTFKGSKLYGGFSYAYTSSLGHDPSGYTHRGVEKDYRDYDATEDLYGGWNSGTLFDGNQDIFVDISGGRQKYNIGTGFLISYGAENGAYRGGGYLWPRTSFDNTIIGRLNVYDTKVEGFYLETRPLDPVNKRSYSGVNVEYKVSETSNLGFSYINTRNKRTLDGEVPDTQVIDNNTYDGRFSFSPLENFQFNSEYAYQVNTTKVSADKVTANASGGFGELEYKRADFLWQPALSYRYAIQDENFDGMSPGMTGWGTWFQGEITGMWMLYNTNLITHMGKLVLNPSVDVTTNLIYFNYTFVNPSAFGQTYGDYGNEVNLITDWQYNDMLKFTASIASFMPGQGGQEYMGGNANKTWLQGMLYASFNY